MDMQGEPIGGNKASTKHTTDPERYNNAVREGAGAIASDSLAAESARSGGAFNENRDSNPQSVPSHQSTFANTDTSGAKTLPPAHNARERDDAWGGSGASEYPESAGGQGDFSGSHAGGSYAGGSTGAKKDFDFSSKGDSYDTSGAGGPSADKISSSSQSHGSSKQGSGSQGSGSDNTGSSTTSGLKYASNRLGSGGSNTGSDSSAPGYVSSVTQPFGQGKPKGNATEGSEEDFKGPSTQDAEIGSDQDPGRRAENDFQRMTQQSSGSTAPRQGAQGGDSQYSMLEGDQQL